MAGFTNFLRHHIETYKLFYGVATVSLYPVWNDLKILTAVLPTHELFPSEIYYFYGYDMTILLFVLATGLKTSNRILKTVSRVILFLGVVCQIALMIIIYRLDFYGYISPPFLLMPLALSAFWIAIYFLSEDTGLIGERLTKKGFVFIILMLFFLYLPKYINDRILNNYLLSNPPPVPSKTTVMVALLELQSTIRIAVFWTSVITAILFFVFFFIYRSVKDELYERIDSRK